MATQLETPATIDTSAPADRAAADKHIESLLDHCLHSSSEAWFEPGVESRIARAIEILVQTYSHEAVDKIGASVISPQTPPHVAAEMAVVLGRLRDEATRDERRGWLERALQSASHHVRDAAGLALASIDDPRSLPAVEQAMAREPFATLKADLQVVANQLREHAGAH